MATTSVKLSEASKEGLDRLQARLTLMGYKLTKEEVLEALIRAGSEKPAAVIEQLYGARFPIPEKQVQAMVDSAEDWGPSSWRDIDRILYGRKAK